MAETNSRDIIAGGVAEIAAGRPFRVNAGERQIALVPAEGRWYAIDSACPHKGGPLGTGTVKGTLIICPWHLFRFDLRTGQSVTNARMSAKTYPVRVENDTIIVSVPIPSQESADAKSD